MAALPLLLFLCQRRQGWGSKVPRSCFRYRGFWTDFRRQPCLCDGLFYVAVLTDLKMYLRLESCKAFKKSLHFDSICRTPICLSECFIPMIMYYPELCICFDELHVRHLPCWELHHV